MTATRISSSDCPYPFVITQQPDVVREGRFSLGTERFDGEDNEDNFIAAWQTKAEAAAALAVLVPEGADPFVYGGYRIERQSWNELHFFAPYIDAAFIAEQVS